MTITVDEVKNYLRVDFSGDDELISQMITAAKKQCMDILRTDDESVLESAANGKIAIFFTVAYLYEHREEADHHALDLTLRSPPLRQSGGDLLMDIAAMNVRITFQKNETVVDKYGNHKTAWTDYFSCYATISGESGQEQAVVGETVENTDIDFTVRYCAETAAVSSTKYRIVFSDELYNILAVDHLSMKKNALKFRCRKERR